jgi:hypothetical protein
MSFEKGVENSSWSENSSSDASSTSRRPWTKAAAPRSA